MKFTIGNVRDFELKFFDKTNTEFLGLAYGQAFTQVFGNNFPDIHLSHEQDDLYASNQVWSWLTEDSIVQSNFGE